MFADPPRTAVGWRRDGTGSYPDADPPTAWAPDQNVVWKTKMPATGNATPVIVGDRLFVCAEKDTLLCVNKNTGEILWSHTNDLKELFPEDQWPQVEKRRQEAAALSKQLQTVTREVQKAEIQMRLATAEGRQKELDNLRKRWQQQVDRAKKQNKPEPPFKEPDFGPLPTEQQRAEMKQKLDAGKQKRGDMQKRLGTYDDVTQPSTQPVNGFTSPTPVSDGNAVYVLFGNGLAARYALDGKRQWLVRVRRPRQGWGHSASPVLTPKLLITQIEQLTALDRETGAVVWDLPKAKACWGTPVLTSIGETTVIVTPAGDLVTAEDGRLIASKLGGLTYAAPIVRDGVVYFIEANAVAVRLPATVDGQSKPEQLWKVQIEKDRYYASAVYRNGLLYAVNQHGAATCLDAADGKTVWTEKLKLGATVYPSVTAAGNLVYFSSDSGKTLVLKVGRTREILQENSFEKFRACPVFEGNRVYIRGLQHLYCLGSTQ